jgi:hypothetical protein
MLLAIVRFSTGAKFKVPNRKMSETELDIFWRSVIDPPQIMRWDLLRIQDRTHFFAQRGSSAGFVTIDAIPNNFQEPYRKKELFHALVICEPSDG